MLRSFVDVCVAVYHVGEQGWTKVWSNDTTEMFYGYYPVSQVVRPIAADTAAEQA